eukprot:CAMPEP_0183294442 /NCGR_PEP_ID=MMETSP0160_2-20130417/2785_1 /TAXON_ID=2839 ORGANISM="Odontella Sinensis, Strain Grunow 1884" /NCGR_SAMPLE_ID=MMETSP0160_2 /ASSEMBLY_ACC=CAM_ASM_000250 /LENGTH=823 /DNA_ID=CAMNT_0025455773 /DNA_START=95 /DNA_END=2566 /DNA_ORIENTATION=+
MRFHRLALTALAAVLACGSLGGNNGFALAQEASEAPDMTEAPAAFTPPENAENFKFEAEVNRMLDIVVNSLYQNKDVFLRELISNASDALDKIRFLALTKPELMGETKELEVRIEYDEEAKTLTVRDTGIGMTHDDLVKNLGTVARSGTTKFLEAMGEGSGDVGMIGQFGVGFYSTFLVADRVSVASKHPDSDTQFMWSSANGEDHFYIAPDPRGNTLGRGTEITLHLKEDTEEYANGGRLRELSKHYSEFITHPIHLRTSEMTTVEIEDEEDEAEDADAEKEEAKGEEEDEDLEMSEEDEEKEEKPKKTKEVLTHSWEEVNTEQAIWTRSKEDITDDEYQGFWKVVSHQEYSDASSWIHFNAEGNINFKSLLYLPSDVPQHLMQGNFDLERKGGLKLYVRKVLISDDFELMPKYLSFIKGVVDSDDLPLNVNRETLQESKIIKVISKKLVRKAIEMLRKLAEKDDEEPEKDGDKTKEAEIDADGNVVEVDEDEEELEKLDKPKPYLTWYKKFAPSLKMGVIEDDANRGKLAKLLRFKSSKTEGEDDYVSLPAYVERMKEWQDDIYVFTGAKVEDMESSHFMDKFFEKDVEVLYLTDPVDEYMTNTLREFDGKKFVAISKEGIKFKDEDEDMVKRREKAYQKKFKPLTKWLNKLYGAEVMRVAISKRLGKAPAIVSSSEYGHTANMERIMRAQAFQHGQDDMMMRAMRILEINPRHPFIEKLLEGCPDEEDDALSAEEETVDAAWLLYDMALLNGGFPISDPKKYSQRMMKVMQMVMGVDDLTLSEEISPPEEEDEPPEVDMDSNEGINIEDFDMDEFEGVDM